MTFRANHLYTDGPDTQGVFGVDSLPLTIVAHIISYLDDDVASLARLCRTSRVLFYMTLPHIWQRVTLKAHSTIHYRDDVPEGFGSASPFSMGLNALVTRNVSTWVRSLRLQGEFKVSDLEEYSKAGRVSESTMILNIAVRAAIDQCKRLESFRWDLNVRLHPNLYAGLAKLSRLESLWIRLSTNRSPQPRVEIPALPNLKSLTFSDYDPLCYPEDLSGLFLHCTKLETLNMHFSPRMRDQGEPSVVLTHFFRKNIVANQKLRIKRLGIYNLLANAESVECMKAVDPSTIEEFTALNTFGLDEDDVASHRSATLFIDRTWLVPVPHEQKAPKMYRGDHLHKAHITHLSQSAGLEYLYLINARHKCDANGVAHSTPNSAEVTPGPPPSTTSSNRSSHNMPAPKTSLRDLYLDQICGVCGPTLKHLILPARWPQSPSMSARLIRSCPNLTQLSMAVDGSDFHTLRMLIPFLSKLWAIRTLAPRQEGEEGQRQLSAHNALVDVADHVHEEKLAKELSRGTSSHGQTDFPKLRYVGLGWKVFEIGGLYEEVVKTPVAGEKAVWDGPEDGDENNQTTPNGWREEIVSRRRVKRVDESEVQDVEIWKMDSMDII